MNEAFAGQGPMLMPYNEAKMARPATYMQRANLAVTEAERRLADVKRAQEILEKHPELQELLDILQRNNF